MKHSITKKQYNYLLPIYGIIGTNKLLLTTNQGVEKYYFIGNYDEYLELLNRCKYID